MDGDIDIFINGYLRWNKIDDLNCLYRKLKELWKLRREVRLAQRNGTAKNTTV